VLRVDVRGSAAKISKIWQTTEAQHPEDQVTLEWMEMFVRNLELAAYWLVIWVTAHLSMVIIGRVFFGPGGGNVHAIIPVELIPGSMVAIQTVRLSITGTRVQMMERAADRSTGTLSDADFPARNGLLMRLLTPGDAEIYAVLALTVVLELVVR
jgi:hypothetical protein